MFTAIKRWWRARHITEDMKEEVLEGDIEKIGPNGERIILQKVASDRTDQYYIFKVYTSERAYEQKGIVTTIWLKDVRKRPAEPLGALFNTLATEYYVYMSFACGEDQWRSIANADSFEVNATGTVAFASGEEIPIIEYVNKRIPAS